MPNRAINHVNMQTLASFVILLVMSPVPCRSRYNLPTECSCCHNRVKLLTQVEQDSLALANVHLRKYPEVFGGGGLYGRGGYYFLK